MWTSKSELCSHLLIPVVPMGTRKAVSFTLVHRVPKGTMGISLFKAIMTKLTDKLGFFTAMPEKVIELTSEIGSDAVFIYLYLRYMTNKKRGCAWPSYDKMRKDTGWGRQRISNALKKLELFKLLIKRKRYGKSTEYVLPKPPDVGGTSDESSSSTVVELIEENEEDDSSIVAEPKKSRSATPVVPKRDKVLKTESTQTESNQTDIKDSRPTNGRNEMMEAVLEVCHLSWKTFRASGKTKGLVSGAAKLLMDRDISPEQLRLRYGKDGWWWKTYWIGKDKKSPPRPEQIADTIDQAFSSDSELDYTKGWFDDENSESEAQKRREKYRID